MSANGVDWQALLSAAVAIHPQGKAGVAVRLGVSRSYVSRALSSGASGFAHTPKKFITRVIDRLHVVAECPTSLQPMARSECKLRGAGPAPTHNPWSMRLWSDCQRCPHLPGKE